MQPFPTLLAALALTACGGESAPAAAPAELPADVAALTLTATDGVKVFARHYRAADPKALILLFHQDGSSKDEYAMIAPRLVAAGYSALAIDQRRGDRMFGPNQTAAAYGREAKYEEALPDMQAALDWAGKQGVPVILWGSSYSSSLIFRLAADNPGKVRALLAFSPGEYFDDTTLLAKAAAKVAVPLFVSSDGSVEEVAAAKAAADALTPGFATVHVPTKGVHGSSLLIAMRNPQAGANWPPVMAFLAKVAP